MGGSCEENKMKMAKKKKKINEEKIPQETLWVKKKVIGCPTPIGVFSRPILAVSRHSASAPGGGWIG